MNRIAAGASILAIVTMAAGPVEAQFYQGKMITMMINYPSGGNTDVEGRIFQRHLAKHIQGKPNIIVNHRPGAGGMVGINWMGSANAPTDGSLFCFCTLNVVEPVIGGKALRVNLQDFAYIAGIRQWFAAYGRKDIPPGIKKPADIAKATDVFGAGYNPSNAHDMSLKLSLELIGAKYRMVSGLRSIGDINLSIQKQETNFTQSSMPAFMSQTLPGMIKDGVAMPFWYHTVTSPDGKSLKRSQELDALSIPAFADVYREAHGKAPSGPEWDALHVIANLSTSTLRAVMMPPGNPKAAIAELRNAFAAIVKDPEFQAEYMRIIKIRAEVVPPEEGERELASIKTVKPRAVEMLKRLGSWK